MSKLLWHCFQLVLWFWRKCSCQTSFYVLLFYSWKIITQRFWPKKNSLSWADEYKCYNWLFYTSYNYQPIDDLDTKYKPTAWAEKSTDSWVLIRKRINVRKNTAQKCIRNEATDVFLKFKDSFRLYLTPEGTQLRIIEHLSEGKQKSIDVVNNKLTACRFQPLRCFAEHLAASLQTSPKIQYCFSANQPITIYA